MAHPPDERSLPIPAPVRTPGPSLVVAPAPDAPSLSELFTFMRDAELRFESLRMRIVDRTRTAAGEAAETHEIWLRHPGHAKVVTRFDDAALRGASLVWVTDGTDVRTYDARAHATSTRPVRPRPEGIERRDLPSFSRVRVPLTTLPMESLPDTFVHPHGFCRNVLATADLELMGTSRLRGREAYVLRADHPRTTEVLTDRPDRYLEVAVDRLTGLILLLVDHVGDQVTRHAEVTDLELDAPLSDDVFVLHASEDVRRLF